MLMGLRGDVAGAGIKTLLEFVSQQEVRLPVADTVSETAD